MKVCKYHDPDGTCTLENTFWPICNKECEDSMRTWSPDAMIDRYEDLFT